MMIMTDVFLVFFIVSDEFERSFVYRNVRTHIQTSVYAISVPIDIIFINCCRSNKLDKTAKHANCLLQQ